MLTMNLTEGRKGNIMKYLLFRMDVSSAGLRIAAVR